MDVGATLIGAGSLVTAIGVVITGVYTGRNQATKDNQAASVEMAKINHANEAAVEEATRGRIEALVADANEARRRFREAEDDHDRISSALRSERQQWWDAAAFNFSMMVSLSHLLNNIFTVAELSNDDKNLRSVVTNARERLRKVELPNSLDETLELMRKPRQQF